MRKAIAAGVICFGACLTFAATVLVAQTQSNKPSQNAAARESTVQPLKVPLNVKTGLWQMTQTVIWTGLPPQFGAALTNGMPAHYQSCVKQTDLLKNPWANGSGQRCAWTVVSSNGKDMVVQGTCGPGNADRMSMQIEGTIHATDPKDGTGSLVVTVTGNGVNATGTASYTGKWIGPTCPADKNQGIRSGGD